MRLLAEFTAVAGALAVEPSPAATGWLAAPFTHEREITNSVVSLANRLASDALATARRRVWPRNLIHWVNTMHRLDLHEATLVAATGVGFLWLYVAMALLKLPAWPPAVAMLPYITRALMSLRADMEVIWEGALGLLCGILVSWIGLEVWAIHFPGDPLAMALVMLATAAALIGLSRLARFHEFHTIVVVKMFLGAVTCFGLFSSFWATRLIPERLLFGWLDFLILSGKAQPYLAGVLAVLSVVIGCTLSYAHQRLTFWLARTGAPDG